MKLHANMCNYWISKFYTRVITHTLHAPYTQCPLRLHAFYARVGAAIPLTSTVMHFNRLKGGIPVFIFTDVTQYQQFLNVV